MGDFGYVGGNYGHAVSVYGGDGFGLGTDQSAPTDDPTRQALIDVLTRASLKLGVLGHPDYDSATDWTDFADATRAYEQGTASKKPALVGKYYEPDGGDDFYRPNTAAVTSINEIVDDVSFVVIGAGDNSASPTNKMIWENNEAATERLTLLDTGSTPILQFTEIRTGGSAKAPTITDSPSIAVRAYTSDRNATSTLYLGATTATVTSDDTAIHTLTQAKTALFSNGAGTGNFFAGKTAVVCVYAEVLTASVINDIRSAAGDWLGESL